MFTRTLVVLFLSTCSVIAADDDVVVEGHVQGSDGKPLQGIKVGLYAAGQKGPVCDPVRTDKDGVYKFTVKIDAPYNMLFTHTNMDPSMVELLAEKKAQKVSIKMFKRGEARPAMAYLDALQAAEKMLVLALLLKSDERVGVVEEYRTSGAVELIRAGKFGFAPQPTQEVRDAFTARVSSLSILQGKLGLK